MDFLAIITFMIRLDYIGFVLATVISLAMMVDVPLMKMLYPPKYVIMILICFTSWACLITTFFISTEEGSLLQLFNLSANPNDENYQKIGAIITYKNYSIGSISLRLINLESAENGRFLLLMFIAVLSGNIVWTIKVGYLGKEYFEGIIDKVAYLPPNSKFKNMDVFEERKFEEKSHYINSFLKNLPLIMDVTWDNAVTKDQRFIHPYFEDIPYLNQKKLIEMYVNYNEFKEEQLGHRQNKLFERIYSMITDSLKELINVGNFVNLLLIVWILFFLFVKNDIPTIYSFFALIGISLLGVVRFETFFTAAQYLILIPLLLNLLICYLSNIESNPLNCSNRKIMSGSVNSDMKFPCIELLGVVIYEKNSQNYDFKFQLDQFRQTINWYLLINTFLFKILNLLFKMLKGSKEHILVESNTEELQQHAHQIMNESNKIPLLKIMIVKISRNFYIICYGMMIYVGTKGATLVNIILLSFLLFFVSSGKLIQNHWIVFYYIMNIIIIGGFLMDLILSSTFREANEFKTDQDIQALIKYLGLPSKLRDFSIDATEDNKNNVFSTFNIFLMLYMFCLIQQIASRNIYLKFYIEKLKTMNAKSKSIVLSFNKLISMMNTYSLKIYYNFGIWIAYSINMILSLTLAVSVIRYISVIYLFIVMLVHLRELRKSSFTGHLNLKTVHTLWEYFFRIKIFMIVFLIVGTFLL